ncbi:liprin-beta-2-like isoform X12 [Huso huso]|uniref:Liprin-beta-2-like isoform X12 n=1 Tax=Huso huso TaxID=61971 RepID=A0ABR0YK57_HUSHU
MVTMSSDASHMLEAALEQMDDIIAGSKAAAEYTNGLFDIGTPVYLGSLQVLQLTEELRIALELLTNEEEKESLRTQISGDTAQYLRDWLETGTVNLRSSVINETYQERLARLEADKGSLVLQVSVLTDQVEAQGEKIRDLESSLDEHNHKQQTTEEMLQQELLSRTYLETQKLDLIDEVSHLKLKLAGMEKEQNDCDEKQHKAESVVNLISELQEQMCRFQQEISTRIQEKREQESNPADTKAKDPPQSRTGTSLASPSRDEESCCCRGENGLEQELKLLKNKVDELEGEKSQYERKLKATKASTDLQKLLATKDAEIECLQTQLSCRTPVPSDSTERDQELQRLKMGMESLLAANEEKDRRIDELTILLNQYRKMKDAMAVAQGSCERILSVSSEEEFSGSMNTRNPVHKTNTENISSEKSSRCSSFALVSPSSIQNELETSCRTTHTSPEPLVSPHSLEDSFKDRQWQQRMLSSSLEELQSGSLQKHVVPEPVEPVVLPENQPHVENNKYQTLPGKFSRANHNGDNEKYKPSSVQRDKDEDEDSEFNLRKTPKIDDPTLSSSDLSPQSSGVDSGQQSPVFPENRKNPKGIKKFWGKIRRTQSGSFQAGDLGTSQFQRGGLRATAGPRLARTKETGNTKSDLAAPFSQWRTEQVCSWLEDFGLSQYVNLARQWVNTGHTLLTASPQDLEKEMGIKQPLHRKKLQLALKAFSMKLVEKSADLDHIWVTRWLDDIGLPQYKDQFNDGRVDGRMLQYLTVNDLLFLKVTSQLHHLSIKCAIHVLHVNKFNPNCLRRRPGDEHNSSPSEVVQWSNHRVMEWLRSVDLAEYAPNLRGSGVHGGLIILEPRFNSDTLAMLLNIPPQKTLLRRHLTTNFNMLIGSEAQQEKREFMESSSYAPLTTTAKVRPKKLGFSNLGHLRKKKFDDSTDYICPMDTTQPATNGAQKGYGGHRGVSPVFDRDLHRLEQMEITEGTVMQIGVLSEGINNLTYMLSHDEFLKDFRRSKQQSSKNCSVKTQLDQGNNIHTSALLSCHCLLT